VICGKCGTSDRTMISTYQGFAQGSPKLMQVICRDCGHEAKADSVVAALLKPVTMRASDGGVRK